MLALSHYSPTLYLHEGGGDGEELEPLHVPDTPAQYFDSLLLNHRTYLTGDNVVGFMG